MKDTSSTKTITPMTRSSRDRIMRNMRAERVPSLNRSPAPFFLGPNNELIPNRTQKMRVPLSMRPTVSRPVVQMRLGELTHRSPNPYNHSGQGAPIKASYKLMGETVQPLDLRGLAGYSKLSTIFRLRPILRMHPFFRAVDLAMTLYDALEAAGLQPQKAVGKFLDTRGFEIDLRSPNCGPGGGPVNNGSIWPNCSSLIPTDPRSYPTANNGIMTVWGPYQSDYILGHPFKIFKPGHTMRRVTPVTPPAGRYRPVYEMRRFDPAMLPMVMRQNRLDTQTRTTSNGPPQRPRTRQHENTPPKKNEREGKLRVGGALATALRAAHFVTEGNDIVDALFEALPDKIQNRTRRTGTLRKGARLKEGTKYLTPWDKAQAVYRNWGSINWTVGARNLAVNQITDRLVGGINGIADNRSNRSLFGARYLQR